MLGQNVLWGGKISPAPINFERKKENEPETREREGIKASTKTNTTPGALQKIILQSEMGLNHGEERYHRKGVKI